jgi:hypothetical protein
VTAVAMPPASSSSPWSVPAQPQTRLRHRSEPGHVRPLRPDLSALVRSSPWFVDGVLVETLLERGAEGDVAEAEAAITRLADAPADEGLVIREVWLLRLRALLAQAVGDETAYRDYRDRYRALATELGFEGHMAWAEAMP